MSADIRLECTYHPRCRQELYKLVRLWVLLTFLEQCHLLSSNIPGLWKSSGIFAYRVEFRIDYRLCTDLTTS
jgi:hypothetical protein